MKAVLARYDPTSENLAASAGPTRLEVCVREIVEYAARHLGPNRCEEPDAAERISIQRVVAELEGLWNQQASMFEALSAILEAGAGRLPAQDADLTWNPHSGAAATRGRRAWAEAGGGDSGDPEAGRNAVRARRVQEEKRRIAREMLTAELATPGVDCLDAQICSLSWVSFGLEPASDGSGRHALVGKTLAEDSRRRLFLGRRRLCLRPDTEDGGSDLVGNLFITNASQAVAAELCGEGGELAGRVERAWACRRPELRSHRRCGRL
jgi:hypothetical protein